jgi:uncharacterized membrane protein (DUF2068 family)
MNSTTYLRANACEATSTPAHCKGLRAVAGIEVLKGILALVAATAVVVLLRRDFDLSDAAENLLYYLHIDPDRRWPHMFVDAAGKVMDAKVHTVLAIAAAYAILRFVEGYGLWRQRAWAEWLAIISGCVYLPFEIYRLVQKPNEFHWIILIINILVVLYIGWVRWDEISSQHGRRAVVPTRVD